MSASRRRSSKRHGGGGTPDLFAAPAVADSSLVSVHVYRCELVEERTLVLPRDRVIGSRGAAEVIAHFLRKADRETFVVLMTDCAGHILGLNVVGVGTTKRVLVTERDVFKPALLRNAERVVVGHNHLDDDPRPSSDDRKLTRALVRAGKALGIPVCDHVIVTPRGESFSFLEEGLL